MNRNGNLAKINGGSGARPRKGAFTNDFCGTSAQVGGWGGGSVVNNGDGTATFEVNNTAGTHSFFLHLVPNRKSPKGMMANIYQNFKWTEPIYIPVPRGWYAAHPPFIFPGQSRMALS